MPTQSSPFPPGSKVAAYLRDSGGDEQDLSVPQQERAVREWCEARSLIMQSVFTDIGTPGSSVVGREGFQQMVRHFRGRNIPEKGLVIWSFSRFSRSIDDAQFYLADLRRRGCAIHSMTDPIPDGTVGKLIEAVYIWKNQDFIENLSREVRRGQQDLMKARGALGGTPPRGFIREPVELGKRRDGSPHIVHRWVPDPAMVETIRLAWQMRAEGASYKRIHAATHIYSSLNSYRTFFTNRLYLGEMEFGGSVIPDYVDPVISQETWDAVQARMRTNSGHLTRETPSHEHPRRVNSRYLLSGLIFCDLCGAPMNGHHTRFSDENDRDYYECSRAQRRDECNARMIPRDTIENAVLDALKEYILAPDVIESIRRKTAALGEQSAEEVSGVLSQVNAQLGSVRQRITNVLNAIEKTPESEALSTRLLSLEQEERDLKRRVSTLERSKRDTRKATDDQMLWKIRQIVEDIEEIDPDELRVILNGFIYNIMVRRTERTIKGEIQFFQTPRMASGDRPFL